MHQPPTVHMINYPINLYLLKRHVALIMVGLILMLPIAYFLMPLVQDNMFAVVAFWLLVFILAAVNICVITFFFSKQPVLQITADGMTMMQLLRYLPKKTVFWREVQSVTMNHLVIKGNDLWILEIQPKQGKVIKYQIRPMRYQNFVLNVNEIMYLVQSAFEGKMSIPYQSIQMNHSSSFIKQMKGLLIAVIVGLVILYVRQQAQF